MKLVTFAAPDGARHVGALVGDEGTISDFTATGNPQFRDMLALIDGGAASLDEARFLTSSPKALVKMSSVRLLAPVPEPRQMFDCLLFEQHFLQARLHAHLVPGGVAVKPGNNEMPAIYRQAPVYYKSNRFSVIGPDADIICPRYSKFLDYELEFGVFLGRTGKDIPLEAAASYIFGYCIFNDVSARDQQFREARAMLGPSKGKDFDTGNVLGPWLVTADEIADPSNLNFSLAVNGAVKQKSNTKQMIMGLKRQIAFAAEYYTLLPGDIIMTGTCSGVSQVKPGDTMHCEIETIGAMDVRVGAAD
jgi:2-keto-4-pentenoate hydratase/2-oxohepta-3-ene-1,7-dioic acid hydratase in catechol pathway